MTNPEPSAAQKVQAALQQQRNAARRRALLLAHNADAWNGAAWERFADGVVAARKAST
jgi:hypothetical protein